jgi:hypothetical protein
VASTGCMLQQQLVQQMHSLRFTSCLF